MYPFNVWLSVHLTLPTLSVLQLAGFDEPQRGTSLFLPLLTQDDLPLCDNSLWVPHHCAGNFWFLQELFYRRKQNVSPSVAWWKVYPLQYMQEKPSCQQHCQAVLPRATDAPSSLCALEMQPPGWVCPEFGLENLNLESKAVNCKKAK